MERSESEMETDTASLSEEVLQPAEGVPNRDLLFLGATLALDSLSTACARSVKKRHKKSRYVDDMKDRDETFFNAQTQF